MIRRTRPPLLALAVVLAGCTETTAPDPGELQAAAALPQVAHSFPAAVFDIAATADGGLLVAVNSAVEEIRPRGRSRVADVPTRPGAAINGLAVNGRGNFFAVSGGLDQAAGAALWRVSGGRARMVADIGAFERTHDPDALEGPRWKDQQCEEDPAQGFTAGPQSNPYHIATLTGSDVLVADAAGNTLLLARANGMVDWVAVFTPPTDETGDYRVLFPLDEETDCYVQPVPTSVAVGPDGAYYVGELTGAPAVPGWSRVWRIEPGSLHTVCPSASCREVISDLTSVIDVEFGPDGMLYVVEYHEAGWFAAFGPDQAGGRIRRCDVGSTPVACETVATSLTLPGAIAFDAKGELWVVEGNITAPEVRRLALP